MQNEHATVSKGTLHSGNYLGTWCGYTITLDNGVELTTENGLRGTVRVQIMYIAGMSEIGYEVVS